MTTRLRCVAIVPSGGSGSRFGAVTPKQYLPLLSESVLHYALAALSGVRTIERVFVGVQVGDDSAEKIAAPFERVSVVATAGSSRSATVLQTLEAIRPQLTRDTWVLVHDAARPCVSVDSIEKLIAAVSGHAVGGLLALPVTDTVKRATAALDVVETVDRSQLWRAQTPQMFRSETLAHALAAAPEATDESQAIEALGLAPKIVQGESNNLKITFPEDLEQAARILRARKTA